MAKEKKPFNEGSFLGEAASFEGSCSKEADAALSEETTEEVTLAPTADKGPASETTKGLEEGGKAVGEGGKGPVRKASVQDPASDTPAEGGIRPENCRTRLRKGSQTWMRRRIWKEW